MGRREARRKTEDGTRANRIGTELEADLFRGCQLAGAIGDALGASVEFWFLSEIRSRLGPDGVTGYVGGGAVTDDTQMALFTSEG
jgi:ADP-ribosylglycohydrolase